MVDDTSRTALDIIRELQEPAGQFGKSMTLCCEAAELLAVLNSGNDAICRKNDELQATIKQLTDALAVRAGTTARDEIIEECAKCVPTSWLDPMLSGPAAVVVKDCGTVERVLRAIAERIRALKAAPGSSPDCDGEAKAGFDAGWDAAIEQAATVAASYPEGFGSDYVAYGLIGEGQDHAASDIAKAIRALGPSQSSGGNP